MLNFTVGPVQSDEEVLAIGAMQVPYFRTEEFSSLMLENEQLMLQLTFAPSGSKAVFLTGSGTAAMEAAIINTLDEHDRAIVVNGGTFGQRFCELLSVHSIPYVEILLNPGDGLKVEDLEKLDGEGYSAFIVNLCETSTSVLYDMDIISSFCRKNGLFLIVDAVSAFLADEIRMAHSGIDVLITGSQKALACPPGVSIVTLSPNGVDRVMAHEPHCMYLDMKLALADQQRGQTPFTPAVGTLIQINSRLRRICAEGGAPAENRRIATLADYFRNAVKGFPFELFSSHMSNAVTALHPTTISAYDLFLKLKDEYGIWICPNGGALKDSVFRVGHLGALAKNDYDKLIEAFSDLRGRGVI